MSWFFNMVVSAILNWVVGFFTGMIKRYQEAKANREENKKIREKLENAETPEEIDEAAEDVANKWNG